jgi:hypothetical protein
VTDTPVVVIAYNRPDKVRRLIARLSKLKPPTIIFAVDGPKPGRQEDELKVQEVRSLVELINWTDRVETRFQPTNLGLRAAVTDVVSHAVSLHGQAVIMEEDTLPGANWFPYAREMLERHRGDSRIEHISGYNLVPQRFLSNGLEGSRLTRYPESIAWATWDRAWDKFDGSLDWALNASIAELARIVGSRAGALRWKQNFADAEANRISTWAYRWIASMWSRDSLVLSPNQNLVTYAGYDAGTNSLMKAPWSELPLYEGDPGQSLSGAADLDPRADEWVGKRVFAENPFGVARGVLITAALATRKINRNRRLRAQRGLS